jgi:hypothetical protein
LTYFVIGNCKVAAAVAEQQAGSHHVGGGCSAGRSPHRHITLELLDS